MGTLVGIGISEHKDPFLAGSEAAKLALYQIHHKEITLGILFTTINFANSRILEGINYALGPIKLIGSTGTAIISSLGVKKYGVGLMLISSDKIKLGIGSAQDINTKGGRIAGEEFAQQALRNLKMQQRDIAIVFSDGLVENGSDLLRGIKDTLGLSFPVIGGSSADNLTFLKTYQYLNTEVLSNSIVGAVFSGENLFGIGLRHGWKPLGKPHTITQATGNVIKKIGDKPAVSIYQEYFGKSLEEVKQSLMRMSTYFPLGIFVPGETEYLLRNTIRIDPEGGLVCSGDAQEGSEIRLMMGTKEWALNAATEAAQEAKNALEGKTIKAVLIFESYSRIKLLGRLTGLELSRIKEILGDVPVLGLCTYGEQAPLKSLALHGQTHFHNETIALLAIGESHDPAHNIN